MYMRAACSCLRRVLQVVHSPPWLVVPVTGVLRDLVSRKYMACEFISLTFAASHSDPSWISAQFANCTRSLDPPLPRTSIGAEQAHRCREQ